MTVRLLPVTIKKFNTSTVQLTDIITNFVLYFENMRIKYSVIAVAIMLMLSVSASATRSPFQTAPEMLYSEAGSFYEGKNYLAAIRYYTDFLKYKPSETQATSEEVRTAKQNIALASYYLREESAFELLEKYLEEYPYTQNAEQIELYLAILDFEKGKYKPALKRLEKIKSDNLTLEEHQQLLFYRGYCYLQQNKYEKASYEFSQLLKMSENKYTIPSHYYYGYSQFNQENYKTALEHLQLVKNEKDYKNTSAYLISQCYYHLDNCERSTAMADSILAADSKTKYAPSLYHTLASCQYKNGEYAAALDNMKKYQNVGRKLQREDLYMLGILYFKNDNPQEAINYLTKVTKPNDAITQNSYFHIAMAQLALGNKKEARLSFESASRYQFDKEISCDALYNYALVTYELSFAPFNESVSAFEKFLKEYPDSKYAPKVYEYLINVYLTTKNYSAAYTSIQNIERKTPAILEAEQRVLFGMGTTQIANRRYTDAAKSFETLLSNKSYNESLTNRSRFWLGECQYRSGKYSEAIANFKHYLATTTSRTEEEYGFAHYNLGYSYLKSDDRTTSNEWFRKFTMLEGVDKQMLADAYNRIGDNYFLQRQNKEAKQAYSNTIKVADKVAGADYALYQLALIDGLDKNYQSKIDNLTKLMTTYPSSEWTDDAQFEIGKSYVALNNTDKAIEAYKKVVATYPKNNPLVPQAKLQIAMLQYNAGNTDAAIAMYKEVAMQYPGTEESQTSMETLESIMVESNRVSEYTTLAANLNKVNKGGTITVKEDSLTYKAAEKTYFRDEFSAAEQGFTDYLTRYPNGKYNALATYYLANCYYRQGNKAKALETYNTVLEMSDNPNREFSLERAAELSYDASKWADASKYYTEILSTAKDAEQISDARYKRMKSKIALNLDATADINYLRTDTRNIHGAEAEYYYVQNLYDARQYATCEKEIFSFIEKGTPHAYYLAKAFIVLADSYLAQDNIFDAKQYLLSLKENYNPAPADIKQAIETRLSNIERLESIETTNVSETQETLE